MAGVTVKVHANVSGPIESGLAPEIVFKWLDSVKGDIAQEGVNQLHHFLMDKTGRATGEYQSDITTTTLVTRNDIRIWNPAPSGYHYGPWLEGVSERNRSTRFKGYHLWRRTRQHLSTEVAPKIVDERTPELLQLLNEGP